MGSWFNTNKGVILADAMWTVEGTRVTLPSGIPVLIIASGVGMGLAASVAAVL